MGDFSIQGYVGVKNHRELQDSFEWIKISFTTKEKTKVFSLIYNEYRVDRLLRIPH